MQDYWFYLDHFSFKIIHLWQCYSKPLCRWNRINFELLLWSVKLITGLKSSLANWISFAPFKKEDIEAHISELLVLTLFTFYVLSMYLAMYIMSIVGWQVFPRSWNFHQDTRILSISWVQQIKKNEIFQTHFIFKGGSWSFYNY